MVDLHAPVRSLRKRYAMQRVIDHIAPWYFYICLVASTLLISIRFAIPQLAVFDYTLFWCALLLPIALIPHYWRQHPSERRLIAEVDLRNANQGMFMAIHEYQNSSAWRNTLPQTHTDALPQLRTKILILPFVGLLSLSLSFALEQRSFHTENAPLIDRFIKPLAEAIEELQIEEIFEEEQIAQWEEELQRIEENAQDGLQESEWYALDALSETLAQENQINASLLGKVQAQSEALAQQSTLNQELSQQLREALGEDLAKLAMRSPSLQQALANMSDENMRMRLANEMAMLKNLNEAQKMALQECDMCQNFSSQNDKNGKAGRASAKDWKQLSDFLQQEKQRLQGQCAGSCSISSFDLAFLQGQQLGKNGINRGPGHAPLGEGNSQRFADGSLEQMNQGLSDDEGTINLAEHQRDAQVEEAAQKDLQRSGVTQIHAQVADAKQAYVAPQHRAAVARYFERDQHQQSKKRVRTPTPQQQKTQQSKSPPRAKPAFP